MSSFAPADCGTNKYGFSTLVSTVGTYIQDIITGGRPSASPIPSLSPVASPSPILTLSPLPSPSPTTNCTLNFNGGLVVTVTAAAAACSGNASNACALAAGDVSGSNQYCQIAKCSKTAPNTIIIKIKLIVTNSRAAARANVIKSFKDGKYYSRFKLRLPQAYQSYQLKTGNACTFPGTGCSY